MSLTVILVEPETAENLGFIARLCANFDVNDLRCVQQTSFSEDFIVRAKRTAVHAAGRIDSIRIFPSLDQALEGIHHTLGFTGRALPGTDPSISARPLQSIGSLPTFSAIVFGRESSGLTTSELEQCDACVFIETSSKYMSLNVSHAVSIALHMLSSKEVNLPSDEEKSDGALRARVRDLWRDFFNEIGFTHSTNSDHILHDVQKLITRLAPSTREAHILMGIVRQARWKIKNSSSAMEPESESEG